MMPLSESEQWLLDEICAYASDVTRRYASLLRVLGEQERRDF